MTALATSGSLMKCSFGLSPSTLVVLGGRPLVGGAPVATINDVLPMSNIFFEFCHINYGDYNYCCDNTKIPTKKNVDQ